VTPEQYHAAVLDTLITELAKPAPERTAKPLPKATDFHVCGCCELPSGWDLEVGYVWEVETPDDLPNVTLTEATLCTPARRIPLELRDVRRIEDDICEEIIEALDERLRKEAEDHHRRGCKCRDCLAERGDWMMDQRKDAQA
jgi:hypothetical protein